MHAQHVEPKGRQYFQRRFNVNIETLMWISLVRIRWIFDYRASLIWLWIYESIVEFCF